MPSFSEFAEPEILETFRGRKVPSALGIVAI